jgi:hypothetical protein
MSIQIAPVSYDYAGASAATGYSVDVIGKAVKAGDLAVRYVVVDGRQLSKPVIEVDELRRWVAAGKTEREEKTA